MQKGVTILGAGSWGMAVSQILSDNDCQATLWEYNTKEARKLESERTREDKLVAFKLPESVTVTSSLEKALSNTGLVILAIPSQNLRTVLNQVHGYLGEKPKLLNLAKGIENKTLKRMS
ncbi:MAG: 2-dehydropantoate 2-reductase N-terminal domain-containing protein, partial [candidate division Zixibacteria bacterium]